MPTPTTFTPADITARFRAEAESQLTMVKSMRAAREEGLALPEMVATLERSVLAGFVSMSLFYEKFGFGFQDFTSQVSGPAQRATGVSLSTVQD